MRGVELEEVNDGVGSVEDSSLTTGGLEFTVATVFASAESKVEATDTIGSGGGGAAVGVTVTGVASCEEAAASRAALCIGVGVG